MTPLGLGCSHRMGGLVVGCISYCRGMARSVATATRVDRDEMLAFVRPRHHGILATTRASGGGLQMSPVTMGVDGGGRVVVASYPERAKVRNIRRLPSVSICVLSDDFGGPWIRLDGHAEIVDLPEAIEPLVDYYQAVSGEHPDWDEYRRAMVEQGKVLIRVIVDGWGPVATGGFPPRLAGDDTNEGR